MEVIQIIEQLSMKLDVAIVDSYVGEVPKMRSIKITHNNVQAVSIEWLCVRYRKLQKQIKKEERPEWLHESSIIEDYFYKTGRSELLMKSKASSVEQMAIMPVPTREEYVAIIEDLLREYYRKQLRMAELRIEIPHARNRLDIPSMTASYSGDPRSGGVSSTIEAIFIRAENRYERMVEELKDLSERIAPMDRALKELDYEQLEVITKKYFVRRNPLDEELIQKLQMGRQKFYELKKTAIIRIAHSLRMI